MQYGVGVIGGREHLAGGFLFEFNTQSIKELDGVISGESFESGADDCWLCGRVLLLVDDVMGDIASPPASDEDFYTDLFGTVYQNDPCGSGVSSRGFNDTGDGDRGHETRCAGADDGNLSGCGLWDHVHRVPRSAKNTTRWCRS